MVTIKSCSFCHGGGRFALPGVPASRSIYGLMMPSDHAHAPSRRESSGEARCPQRAQSVVWTSRSKATRGKQRCVVAGLAEAGPGSPRSTGSTSSPQASSGQATPATSFLPPPTKSRHALLALTINSNNWRISALPGDRMCRFIVMSQNGLLNVHIIQIHPIIL